MVMEKRIRLADRVVVHIQEGISTGKYKPGDKLPPEPEMMAEYGVGRSTVREAVKTLVMNGTLRVQQGDGTYVLDNKPEEMLDQRLRRASMADIQAVRSLLEQEIVTLAAQHRTEKDLQEISSALQLRKAALDTGSHQEVTDTDIEFHLAIARASGNAVLADLYASFSSAIKDFFTVRDGGDIQSFIRSQPLHEALLQAIRNGRPAAAVKVLQQIISNKDEQ